MTILRLLNIQGIAGLAAALCLALLLVIQKGETRHWRKESARLEALYRDDHSAFAVTVANYRAAAAAARAVDQAAAARVAAAQDQISERTAHDFESRIAAARARIPTRERRSDLDSAQAGAGATLRGKRNTFFWS